MYQDPAVAGPLSGLPSAARVQPTPESEGLAMRVLVAGDRGYIGAVLVPYLRAAGHEVDGLDLGLYEGCDLGPAPEDISQRRALDIRDVVAGQLAGYDAVACLAALSNDPLGHLN